MLHSGWTTHRNSQTGHVIERPFLLSPGAGWCALVRGVVIETELAVGDCALCHCFARGLAEEGCPEWC